MLGGTDHRGLIDQVLPVVRYAVGSEATVYAIGVEPDAIRHAGVKATGRLTAQQMKELFDGLDLLVTAAGQTVAEAVSCELPTVMIQTAENQTYNVEGLLQSQAAVAGGTIEDFVKGKTSHILTDISRQVTARANMAQICKKLRLDRSTDRVAMIIMDQQ
jgi:spore coat polysaccharide biosynthesis predicted glycosyltransferase SpsG